MTDVKIPATVALCNLGCSKNQVDGEQMLGYLAGAGYTVTDDFSLAEVVLVNTCAFIQEAKQEAIDTILELSALKRSGRCRFLGVCGCFSERYRAQAARDMPEVDRWFGVHDWRTEFARVFGGRRGGDEARFLTTPGATQYLKISEGCSRRCAFCAIPSIRGPFQSRPFARIVSEAHELERQGGRECILVSQDTTSYGRDIGTDLVRLVERLLKETAFDWIRLMYLHPSQVSDDLLGLVASEERVCSYVDIPLQHVADPVLRAMRRRPLQKGMRALIERIRARAPNAAIRSTFIVGFPGETERDFRELLGFIEWAKLEKVGVFPFSPEEGTAAYSMRPRPRESTATRRSEELLDVQREISAEIGARRVGARVRVIVDGISDDGCCDFVGRTQWDAPEVDGTVHVRGAEGELGVFAMVRVVDADAYDLFASAVS